MTDPRCWNDLATENAALRAENARLRQVLRNANAMIDQMCDQALACGVAGTSDWDMIAGGADIFGVQDVIRAALAHGIAHDQAPYDPES